MDIEKMIGGYVALRNKKKEIETRHKEELSPVKELMLQIEIKMMEYMSTTGATSFKTDAGTAYRTVRSSATVADRDVFMHFCETEDAWEMADIRASKSAIQAMLSDTGELPPGINWREEVAVNFNSPKAKS